MAPRPLCLNPLVGERAARFFQDAEKLGGIPTKARLASLARVTSAEAVALPDDAPLLARLSSAFNRLQREVSGTSVSGVYVPPSLPPAGPHGSAVEKLRKQMGAIVDLMTQRSLLFGDLQETVRRVDEVATTVLPVSRASVWMRDSAFAKITCVDLFDANKGLHYTGAELHASDFRPYFEALQTERTIMATDARNDPRTSCFTRAYLEPNGIGAMLDVPIIARGKVIGVTCYEHVGGVRRWDADDERFAYAMASFVALASDRISSSPPPRP